MAEPQYPQSEKLRATADERHAVGDFLEFLRQQGIELAPTDERNYPLPTEDSLVMKWLGVDEKALERERRAMLEALRG
jgi:hypothetical protein